MAAPWRKLLLSSVFTASGLLLLVVAWNARRPSQPVEVSPKAEQTASLEPAEAMSAPEAVDESALFPEGSLSLERLPDAASGAIRDDEVQRLWRSAQQSATLEDWQAAVRSAQAALELLNQRRDGDADFVDRILEALAFWNAQQRNHTSARSAARNLADLRTKRLGESHWRTINAVRNLALLERLSQLTDDQWQQFQQADRACTEAVTRQRSGDYSGALTHLEEALPRFNQLLGSDADPTLSCLSITAVCLLELGRYFEARPLVLELIEQQPRAQGVMHPDTLLSLRVLARFNESIADYASAEQAARRAAELSAALLGAEHPEALTARVDLARIQIELGQFDEAQSTLTDVLQMQRQRFGKDELAAAHTEKVLGTLYGKQGDTARAEPLLVHCAEVFLQRAGDHHLATAGAYNALGKLRLDAGRFAAAAQALQVSYDICQRAVGDDHPMVAKVLENQARYHELSGNLGMARQLRLHCLRIAEKSYGELNSQTAEALEQVARTYIAMNDFSLAEPYLLRARQIRSQTLGERHPQTAAIVSQLGFVYLGTGDPNRAEPLLRESLAILTEAPGADPAVLVRIHKRLALLYQSVGRFDEAEAEYRRALQTLETVVGPEHLSTAEVQVGLAQTLLSRGDCAGSCRTIDATLHTYAGELHPDSPLWIDALGVAGVAHLAAGEVDLARRILLRGLQVSQRWMDRSGAFESERQRLGQIALLRSMLDAYLSATIAREESAHAVYPAVLAWKGAIALREWKDRQHGGHRTEELSRQIQDTVRKLGVLTLNVPEVAEREAWMQQIFALNLQKEALEQERAIACQAAEGVSTVTAAEDLQRALPAGAALVDLLQYNHTTFGPVGSDGSVQTVQKTPHFVAFVLRPDHAIECIPLGEAAPMAEAVVAWRKTRGFRPNKGQTDWASVLSRQLWEPLQPHLEGCSTLLVSPDGVLAQLAWSALPGRTPGTYLVEDYALAVVPVPQLLPALLGGARSRASLPPSLLLVGDIDYDRRGSVTAGDAPAESERDVPFHFSALQGAAAEVAALRQRFEQAHPAGALTVLDRTQATEAAFWREAPRHRFVHLATHGFHAPPSVQTALAIQSRMDPQASERSGVSVFHANFLNGVALAGANAGPADDLDDGILTAAEWSAMDLRNVELVVLSGCETGLGEVQGGEGAFGMQRAVQIAGAAASIGSLWTVPDTRTSLLMQRFYANLWERRLSKLEALREAQLWMLRTGGKPETAEAGGERTSPHYWASFVLCGDWR